MNRFDMYAIPVVVVVMSIVAASVFILLPLLAAKPGCL